MGSSLSLISALLPICFATSQEDIPFIRDPGISGPPLEIVHAFYGQLPTGVAVSSTGRIFANFPAGIDAGNVNNGTAGIFQVAELTSLTTEVAYPSVEMNTPPGGAINRTMSPATAANYADYLIGVQSVVVDSMDRLWILDTGRAVDIESGRQVEAVTGGPKLVGVNLTTNQIFKTIVFPSTIALPTGYLNDVRFDLRPDITNSGQGVAYITDSGGQGLIVVDLATGESWQHLYGQDVAATHPEIGFRGFVWGLGSGLGGGGADGIALSPDGATLYFGPIGSRMLYNISTELLRQQGNEAVVVAGIQTMGEKGWSDGLECDNNSVIYAGNNELNSIVMVDPRNGTVSTFVRDPRISWVDTMSTASDGYLYFTVNQLIAEAPSRPFGLFRAPLPDGGRKISKA